MATMSNIAVGHVSKVCLCVRNTGSRAAFVKTMAFFDVQTRTVMDSSIISIAPSQFVLKERTQEVGTNKRESHSNSENTPSQDNIIYFNFHFIIDSQYYCFWMLSGNYCANKVIAEGTEPL